MMIRTMLKCLTLLLLWPMMAMAEGNDVGTLLERFNQSANVSTANEFFRGLKAEGLTDSLYQYRAGTPVEVLQSSVWYWAAEWFYDRQNYDQAEAYGLKALPLFTPDGNSDTTQQGDLLNLLAITFTRQGEFTQAAKYAKMCNELDVASGNPDNIASSLNTLAGIYLSARQPEKAEEYVLKGIEYARQTDNQARQAVLHGMASEVYHQLHQEQRALDYATQAYEMERALGRTDKMAIRQAMRAAALIALNRKAEAKKALEDCIPVFRSGGNKHSLGIACNQMGLLLHQENNDTAAANYYNEALAIFTQQHDLYNESHSRKGLYEVLRRTEPALAMEHNDRYNELRDSLYDRETGELLSKYAAEYGYEQLQAENDEMRQARRWHLAAGIAVVLALLLTGLLAVWLTHCREQRRTKRLIEQVRRSSLATVEAVDNTPSEDTPVGGDAGQNAFLKRVVEVVNESLPSSEYSVNAIAAQLNMSASTFRRRLQEASGETPKAFILAIQMEKAGKLLKGDPDIPVWRVASLCGFTDVSSFGRTFKRVYGVSPTSFRG